MFVDNECILSDAQDISQTAGSYYSTYAYNLGSTRGDVGAGKPVGVVFCIDEALDSSGDAATCVFALIDEADTTLDSGSVVLVQTRALTETELTKGKTFFLPLPAGISTKQYLGVKYTIAGETSTSGTVTAFVAFEAQQNTL